AGLQKAAAERRQAVAILRTAIAERRELLLSMGADPGPLPESVAEALSLPDEPLDDEGLKALPSGRGYSRGVVADFFRPPSPEQIEARIRLQAAVGSLTVLCRKLLDTAEILNGEARRLEGLLDSASAEGRGMPV
ncbi:MAG TPA: hypothetical protein VEU28_00605, partial [Actinomycetota bacterium]|nr:hypothetical protein [Actinomycetota bacterium]